MGRAIITKCNLWHINKPYFFNFVVSTIFILGVILNYWTIKAPYFIDDDTDILVGVNDINLTFKKMHLPFGYVHGPSTFYITKLSSILFGKNYFGWRFIQYLSTIFIIFIIYYMTMRIFHKTAAFFALCLSVLNLFFIYNSNYIGEEIYFILFNTLALMFFFISLKENKERDIILTSIMIGLGFMTKITTIWLPVSLIIYIFMNRSEFYFVKKNVWFKCLFIIILFILPYLYWLINSGEVVTPYVYDLFGAQMRLNIPQLFIGYFTMANENIDYNLGYNIVGPIQGLIGFCGIIYCLIKRKDKYVNLLNVIFLVMLFISLFIFSGKGAEPRHFSLLIVISIIAGSILLNHIWKKSAIYKILVIMIVSIILIETVSYVSKLKSYYYPLHSKLRLSSWGMGQEQVDLNEISKKFINLCYYFKPSLIIFPAKGLDSTAHFVTAYTGIKTMSSLIIDKYLHYDIDDLQRVVIFFTSEDNIDKYIKWARAKNYNYYFQDSILNIMEFRLPIKILFMSGERDNVSIEDISLLKSMIYR